MEAVDFGHAIVSLKRGIVVRSETTMEGFDREPTNRVWNMLEVDNATFLNEGKNVLFKVKDLGNHDGGRTDFWNMKPVGDSAILMESGNILAVQIL